jgi:hypothetical protein
MSAGVTAMSNRAFGVDNLATVTQFRAGVGLQNLDSLVGPVVINQIMYQPVNGSPRVENPDDDYVELFNVSGSAVLLLESACSTNSWRPGGSVGFEFPTNMTSTTRFYRVVAPGQ